MYVNCILLNLLWQLGFCIPVIILIEDKNVGKNQCCGSVTIFSDPDPIFRRVLDPDPKKIVTDRDPNPTSKKFRIQFRIRP
jgi:hypothetical protein